jgi:hypothetical protein
MKILLLFLLLNKTKPVTDTVKTKPIYFIAMEYKGISNCIYKVFITDSAIMCAKVNGYITISPSFGMGTVVPKNVMHNPEAYVNKKMEAKYDLLLLTDEHKFLKADRQNFVIRKTDIKNIYHDPTKKWGMGYYPHNGKIIIQTTLPSYREIELILVGDQNADEVLQKLK